MAQNPLFLFDDATFEFFSSLSPTSDFYTNPNIAPKCGRNDDLGWDPTYSTDSCCDFRRDPYLMDSEDDVTSTSPANEPAKYFQFSDAAEHHVPVVQPLMKLVSKVLEMEDVSIQLPNAFNAKIELKILSQPSKTHRARYRTEGSRGAVKDRNGRGFPVVKLCGYNSSPVKLRCYIGHDNQIGDPHFFYQASKIVGKSVAPCLVNKVEGIKVVEIDLLPSNDMEAVVNCVGIVKERNFDVQRKASNLKKKNVTDSNMSAMERRSTSCSLVFGCQIPMTNELLQVVSDPINCAQLLGSPEVHKISCTRSSVTGGDEVFVIGKNFTRDAKVIWEYESFWYHISNPDQEFLNQNHIICKVPPYKGPLPSTTFQKQALINVTFKIKCGDKYSEPYLYTFVNDDAAFSGDNKIFN